MARIRSVKPEYWSDRKLSRVSRDARLLYIALWNLADEHGRLQGDARYVKGQCFPYDDDLDSEAIETLVKELEHLGRVVRYEHDDEPYLYLPTLGKHQRLEAGKVPSRLPAPPDLGTHSHSNPDKPAPHADSSESRADESAPDADELSLLYVAGSREHVTAARGPARADTPAQRAAKPGSDDDSDFQAFWAAYPSRVAKGQARRAWAKAVRDGTPAQVMIRAAEAYARDPTRKPNYTKNPATWINGECWKDEPPPGNTPGQGIETTAGWDV